MKKSVICTHYGWSYVETVVAMAIFAIIVILFPLLVGQISRAGVKQKQKLQANQFANAVVDDLRRRAVDQYIGVLDGEVIEYVDIMNIESKFKMKAVLDVKSTENHKKVGITVTWTDPTTQQELSRKYHTRVNPRGILISGGIVKGRVLYIKSLDDNLITLNKIPEYTQSTKHLFEEASGVMVMAESEGGGGEKVKTTTDNEGRFRLRNIKLNGTDVSFFKQGSKVNSSESRTAYYFFDNLDYSQVPGGYPGLDYPCNQRGVYQTNVTLTKPGEETDIGEIICARAWDVGLQIVFKDDSNPTPPYFCEPNSLKVSGDTVRWGTTNDFQLGKSYWSISGLIQSTPDTIRGSSYNLKLKNLRGAYVPANQYRDLKLKFECNRTYGSSPEITPDDSGFFWGILKHAKNKSWCWEEELDPVEISLNPVGYEPFGKKSMGSGNPAPHPHLIAPAVESAAFPIANHTENFINTLNIADTSDPYITPMKVEFTRPGWIVCEVVDGHNNNPDLSGLTVTYRTNGYRYGSYITTRIEDWPSTTVERVGSKNESGLYNIIKWEKVYFITKNIDHHVSFVETDFHVYGKINGVNYWGLPETINGNRFDDPDGYADRGKENKMTVIVYPGADVSGRLRTTNNRDIPFWIYAYGSSGRSEGIHCSTTLKQEMGINYREFFLSGVRRSCRDKNKPIVAISDLTYGVTAQFNLTVKGKGGEIIPDAYIMVQQYAVWSDKGHDKFPKSSTGWIWCKWPNGSTQIYTDANGIINSGIIIPYTARWSKLIDKDQVTSFYFEFTDVDPTTIDAIKNPYSCKVDDAVDDKHSCFYLVYAVPPNRSGYLPKKVYYNEPNAFTYADPTQTFDPTPSHSTNGYQQIIGDPNGFADNTVITGTIYLSRTSSIDYMIDLIFKFRDGTILPAKPLIDVVRIEIEDRSMTRIYTPGMVDGGTHDLNSVKTDTGTYKFDNLPLKYVTWKDIRIELINAYTSDGKEMAVHPQIFKYKQDGTYVFDIEPPSGG